MASYVIVWENNTVGHMKVKGAPSWPGHASMNIGDTFVKSERGARVTSANYVSWWPGHADVKDSKAVVLGALGPSATTVLGPTQTGSRKMTFQRDVEAEKYLPDHVIRLNSDKAQENRMLAAWQEIYGKEGSSFRFLRKNCSTVCSRVLHAGGFYGKKWALNNNFFWTPADVRKLATSAGGEFMCWDDFLAVLERSNIAATDLTTSTPPLQVTEARSGVLCTTGAPCHYQKDKQKNSYSGNRRHAMGLDD